MQIPVREPGVVLNRGAAKGASAAQRVNLAGRRLLKRAGQIRLAWRLIIFGMIACAMAIIWLSQTSTMVSLGYQMDEIDQQEALLNRQAEAINTEIGQLTNLHRIDQEARDKLGMIEATKFVYVNIPASQESAVDGDNANPHLYQVSDWWRIVSQMLPYPWRDGLPVRPK